MIFLIFTVIARKNEIIYLIPLYHQVQTLKLVVERVFVKMTEAVNVILVMVDMIVHVNH